MIDNFFLKIASHKLNLKNFQEDIICCTEPFNTKYGLNNFIIKNNNIDFKEIPRYEYFKTIQLEDIINLRLNFDINNENHQHWCKKIYRFLEFRLSNIENVINKKNLNKFEKVVFIQNIITLMLEYYDKSKDSRFLSIALKLLRNRSLAKQNCLSIKYNGQYSYNIIAVHNLIKSF